jgi:Mg/Co/Ni transporter MgtE
VHHHLTSKFNIAMKRAGVGHLSGWVMQQLCIIRIISFLTIETDAVVEYGHFSAGTV